ncbi:MAG: hypothetical protein K9G62_02810 [Alphaproteobacteria bacterium]|nr:hypothetical protein [Alphaproteobacteria bacterium]
MRIFLLAGMFMVWAAGAQAAGSSCYSDLQAEAEQGIRIHSELMVIGLNCQHMGTRHGMDLYGDYRKFSARYGELFANYEKVLMDFFRKRGDANPEASLNTLRTNFANKISKDAAGMRPDIFCSQYAPRITQASSMGQTDVRKWAATIYPSHPLSRPLCGEG